jgi:hypothetical protein
MPRKRKKKNKTRTETCKNDVVVTAQQQAFKGQEISEIIFLGFNFSKKNKHIFLKGFLP